MPRFPLNLRSNHLERCVNNSGTLLSTHSLRIASSHTFLRHSFSTSKEQSPPETSSSSTTASTTSSTRSQNTKHIVTAKERIAKKYFKYPDEIHAQSGYKRDKYREVMKRAGQASKDYHEFLNVDPEFQKEAIDREEAQRVAVAEMERREQTDETQLTTTISDELDEKTSEPHLRGSEHPPELAYQLARGDEEDDDYDSDDENPYQWTPLFDAKYTARIVPKKKFERYERFNKRKYTVEDSSVSEFYDPDTGPDPFRRSVTDVAPRWMRRWRGEEVMEIPDKAIKIWQSPPEVEDHYYGNSPDCEAPSLYTSKNMFKWAMGYYSERERRHRGCLFSYIKASRRATCFEMWEIFDLEDSFRVELQLLVVHLWIAKTKMMNFPPPIDRKMCYEVFRIFFNELRHRFSDYVIAPSSKAWDRECQQACVHLSLSLDYAYSDAPTDPQAFCKVIWQELYLSDMHMDHDVLYLWSEYIFREINNVNSVEDDLFFNGWWTFGPIPTMEEREVVRRKLMKLAEEEAEKTAEKGYIEWSKRSLPMSQAEYDAQQRIKYRDFDYESRPEKMFKSLEDADADDPVRLALEEKGKLAETKKIESNEDDEKK